MIGNFVHKDTGKRLTRAKKKDRQDLLDAGHPYIETPIPPGVYGRVPKWNFGLEQWEIDMEEEQGRTDRKAGIRMRLKNKAASLSRLSKRVPGSPVSKEDFDDVINVLLR
jgi:hypothetical protein